jgi:hypothetical protein
VNGDLVALLLIFAAHLIALAVVIGPLLRSPRPDDDPGDTDSSDDDGGDGGSRRPFGGPVSPKPWGGLPLPDAVQSRMRLRGPGRLADLYDAPRRGAPAGPSRHPVRH